LAAGAGAGPPTTPARVLIAGDPTVSSALYTDQYELTMLDAALQAGTAGRRATFEVFARRLPEGREFGVFCGLGRLIEAIEQFRFGPAELDWLAAGHIVTDATLEWLSSYRFSGNLWAYREGELYGAESPVVTVEAGFGEAVLLETITLSILNHDAAVAAAAARIVAAAGSRPIIEMGSRRTDPESAVSAARAAWIAGLESTSNLEAGRRYGIPTAGTAAHAFTMLFTDEQDAFAAQVAALGAGTTLLVDTYDTEEGVRRAVAAAGIGLGAIRIDSGRLAEEARRSRRQLDELGATGTRIVVTGDLDEDAIRQLAAAPADAYGVGTSVVTGGGSPTAGLVYKLVAVADSDDPAAIQHPAEKHSPGKATLGRRKWAWRLLDTSGVAIGEEVATDPQPPHGSSRPLPVQVIRDGEVVHRPTLPEIREHHRRAHAELPAGHPLPVHIRP
jgi:nicotinate phosphoribosyltransferase